MFVFVCLFIRLFISCPEAHEADAQGELTGPEKENAEKENAEAEERANEEEQKPTSETGTNNEIEKQTEGSKEQDDGNGEEEKVEVDEEEGEVEVPRPLKLGFLLRSGIESNTETQQFFRPSASSSSILCSLLTRFPLASYSLDFVFLV